ncbi:hypothetical protein BH10PSE13_BH10PSE13_17600 [soil metagenome]
MAAFPHLLSEFSRTANHPKAAINKPTLTRH